MWAGSGRPERKAATRTVGASCGALPKIAKLIPIHATNTTPANTSQLRASVPATGCDVCCLRSCQAINPRASAKLTSMMTMFIPYTLNIEIGWITQACVAWV